MSVAADFVPVVHIPARARHQEYQERPPAEVVALYAPSEQSVAPPLRLTRRGMAVLAAAVAVVCSALVWVAWLSAPSAAPSAGRTGSAAGAARTPVTVTVQAGDTLWSIAGRVAPDADPRVEVARLQKANALAGVDLVVGQQLRLR